MDRTADEAPGNARAEHGAWNVYANEPVHLLSALVATPADRLWRQNTMSLCGDGYAMASALLARVKGAA